MPDPKQPRPICPKCAGWTYYDPDDDDLHCVNCGWCGDVPALVGVKVA